jgi:hypothetical protein
MHLHLPHRDVDLQDEAEQQLVSRPWFQGEGRQGRAHSEGRDWNVYFQVLYQTLSESVVLCPPALCSSSTKFTGEWLPKSLARRSRS